MQIAVRIFCVVWGVLGAQAWAQSETTALDKVLSVTSTQALEKPKVSDVRMAVLKDIGRSVGLRAGLQDEGKAIIKQLATRKEQLDTSFHFGALVLPTGAFPPVVEEARSVISVTDYSMRVAGVIYRIYSPAKMLAVPPTWRDYLYMGLDTGNDPLIGEAQSTAYPKDEHEAAYWKQVVQQAYAAGREQAQKTFKLNLSRLERDFNGMRKFYELHARGLVTAPVVSKGIDAVSKPDANTIVIGETIFRITRAAGFTESTQWTATQ